ncbi:dTDP-4-dehydrorhamnose 3,5-epimerase [soil metagenome]
MKITQASLPGVLVVEPRIFRDERGFFLETHSERAYGEAGIGPFVQDNFSHSVRDTVRGLHFQEPEGQGKLCTILRGSVYDVFVDVRRGSPTFGQWGSVELDEETMRQVWIPPGFAHGFCVTSDVAHFHYKCTRPYAPTAERTIVWNDPVLAIPWPLRGEAIVSGKDRVAPTLADSPVLPQHQS